MRYILDSSGYVESVSCTPFNCKDKSCKEYTGSIPSGYDSLEEWATTANIRAYKITSGNLVYDSARDAALQAEWETHTTFTYLNETYAVKYRKVGTDTEINVRLGTSTTFAKNSVTSVGTLEAKYRPVENIYVPLFAVNASNAGINTLRLLIQTSGAVSIQNIGGSSVTVAYLSNFVRYSNL